MEVHDYDICGFSKIDALICVCQAMEQVINLTQTQIGNVPDLFIALI